MEPADGLLPCNQLREVAFYRNGPAQLGEGQPSFRNGIGQEQVVVAVNEQPFLDPIKSGDLETHFPRCPFTDDVAGTPDLEVGVFPAFIFLKQVQQPLQVLLDDEGGSLPTGHAPVNHEDVVEQRPSVDGDDSVFFLFGDEERGIVDELATLPHGRHIKERGNDGEDDGKSCYCQEPDSHPGSNHHRHSANKHRTYCHEELDFRPLPLGPMVEGVVQREEKLLIIFGGSDYLK